jgi:hypothetical protein
MVHINHSPFETFMFNTLDKQKVEHHVIVIRGTFKITSNARLSLADVQSPVLVSDQFYGEPDSSGCRQESDLSPFKPACDIVLDATAYAPGGKPTQAWLVSVSVGRHRKQLRVSGPRWFSHHLTGWHVTSVMPIHTLPVRYEYAYGGTVTVYDFKTRQEHTDCCDRNPLGVGYWPDWARTEARRRKRVPIPQIRSTADRVPVFGRTMIPQGLGPIRRTWQPRLKLAGTYDSAWLTEHHPYLPRDFDFSYWNCAHSDLQIPYPQGNEMVELHNLSSDGHLAFALPGHLPFVLVRHAKGQINQVAANLDTLFIEPEARRVSLVWRALVKSVPPVRVLESRMISSRQKHAMSKEASHGR